VQEFTHGLASDKLKNVLGCYRQDRRNKPWKGELDDHEGVALFAGSQQVYELGKLRKFLLGFVSL